MNKKLISTKKLCFIALFMSMNIILSSFSIPVPGGHFYLCDVIICFAALVFDPFSAFIVGGVGSFLGDLIFYPTPMFVSLATHGLQAIAISLIAGKKTNELPKVWRTILALSVGVIIMVTGYSLGRAFVYSTPEYALVKLPYEIGQAVIGAVIGALLLYKTSLRRVINDIPKE